MIPIFYFRLEDFFWIALGIASGYFDRKIASFMWKKIKNWRKGLEV